MLIMRRSNSSTVIDQQEEEEFLLLLQAESLKLLPQEEQQQQKNSYKNKLFKREFQSLRKALGTIMHSHNNKNPSTVKGPNASSFILSCSGECINKLQEAVSRRRRINKSSLAAQYDTVAAA